MNIMKTFVGSLLFVAAAMVAHAQEEGVPTDPIAQEKIKALRVAYISERLQLTPNQAEKFWPIYREFAEERKKVSMELKAAQRDINPNNPDPEKQQRLVELGLQVKQRELDLEKEYSGRLMKVINAQQMLNLRQAEQDFRTLVQQQVQQRRIQQQRRENFRENQRLRQRN
jgi:CHASE2 domain-containing sensor protein